MKLFKTTVLMMMISQVTLLSNFAHADDNVKVAAGGGIAIGATSLAGNAIYNVATLNKSDSVIAANTKVLYDVQSSPIAITDELVSSIPHAVGEGAVVSLEIQLNEQASREYKLQEAQRAYTEANNKALDLRETDLAESSKQEKLADTLKKQIAELRSGSKVELATLKYNLDTSKTTLGEFLQSMKSKNIRLAKLSTKPLWLAKRIKSIEGMRDLSSKAGLAGGILLLGSYAIGMRELDKEDSTAYHAQEYKRSNVAK